MHADEHAGAMYMTMTVMRPGLFFQREEPGSEPGNSLGCPDAAACSVCGSLGGNQCRASLLRKQHKQHKANNSALGVNGRRGDKKKSINHRAERKGKRIAVRSSFASASVFALVLITTPRPGLFCRLRCCRLEC